MDAEQAATYAGLYSIVVATRPVECRGLSDHAVKALIDAGIDAPERLLFMTLAQLCDIPGVGKAALAEIMLYRSRFLPK